jgi:ABC-type lipoprotein release transport system permease subunit
VLDAGSRPRTVDEVALGSDLADILGANIGDFLNLTDHSLNLSLIVEVSGILHELGQPLNKYCIALRSTLHGDSLEQSNLIGIKLAPFSQHASDQESRAADLSSTIGTRFSDTTALLPKSTRFAPIRDAIESSKWLFFSILSLSLVSAAAAAFSLVTVNINESMHNIGLLTAIGFPKRKILQIFFVMPLLVGLLASVLAATIALPLSLVLQPYLIAATRVLFLRNISTEISTLFISGNLMSVTLESIVFPALLGFAAVMTGGFLPVIRSRNLSPQEAMMPQKTVSSPSRLGLMRRGILVMLILVFDMFVMFSMPDATSSVAESFGLAGAFSVLILIALALSFGWFVSELIPSIIGLLKLPKRLSGDTLRLAGKSLLFQRDAVNMTMLAISISVLVIMLSSSFMNGAANMVLEDAYTRNGSDLLVTGSSRFADYQAIENITGISQVAMIMAADGFEASIDGNYQVTNVGQILAYFALNSTKMWETVQWTRIKTTLGLETSIHDLDSREGVVLTSDLSEFLGKGEGESVRLNLTAGAGNETELFFSHEYVVLAVTDSVPGLPQGNPFGLFPADELMGLELLRVNRALVKLEQAGNYHEVMSSISSMGLYLEIDSTQAQQNAFEELVDVVSGIFLFAGTISILTISMTLASVLISEVLARKYEYGVLRAVGFTLRQTYAEILFEGLGVGIMGIVVGLLIYLWELLPQAIMTPFGIFSTYALLLSPTSFPLNELALLMLLVITATSISGASAMTFIRGKKIIALLEEETY